MNDDLLDRYAEDREHMNRFEIVNGETIQTRPAAFEKGDIVTYTYIAVPENETITGTILWLTPGRSEARILVGVGSKRYRAGDTLQMHCQFLRHADGAA